jgi:hypothetical protein
MSAIDMSRPAHIVIALLGMVISGLLGLPPGSSPRSRMAESDLCVSGKRQIGPQGLAARIAHICRLQIGLTMVARPPRARSPHGPRSCPRLLKNHRDGLC